jgi:hypothetical protein
MCLRGVTRSKIFLTSAFRNEFWFVVIIPVGHGKRRDLSVCFYNLQVAVIYEFICVFYATKLNIYTSVQEVVVSTIHKTSHMLNIINICHEMWNILSRFYYFLYNKCLEDVHVDSLTKIVSRCSNLNKNLTLLATVCERPYYGDSIVDMYESVHSYAHGAQDTRLFMKPARRFGVCLQQQNNTSNSGLFSIAFVTSTIPGNYFHMSGTT